MILLSLKFSQKTFGGQITGHVRLFFLDLDIENKFLQPSKSLTLFGTGLKIYVKWRGEVCSPPPPLLNTQNHCEKPKNIFCFSDRSYRNRKSHEIWGHLEAILRVLELIFGRGVLNTTPPRP